MADAPRLTLPLDSLEATRRCGRAIGAALPRRAILCCSGGMGSGKTTLIKAICEGLGIAPETVISPTYTLVNIYHGRWPVYHVDLFRIEKPEALLELDRDDWVNPAGPTLIEWPELARPLLRGEHLLEGELAAPAPDRRVLTLSGDAESYGAVFAALRGEGAASGAVHEAGSPKTPANPPAHPTPERGKEGEFDLPRAHPRPAGTPSPQGGEGDGG